MNHTSTAQFPIYTQLILTPPKLELESDKNLFTVDTSTLFCNKLYTPKALSKTGDIYTKNDTICRWF